MNTISNIGLYVAAAGVFVYGILKLIQIIQRSFKHLEDEKK